jgi:hypothetical protein
MLVIEGLAFVLLAGPANTSAELALRIDHARHFYTFAADLQLAAAARAEFDCLA